MRLIRCLRGVNHGKGLRSDARRRERKKLDIGKGCYLVLGLTSSKVIQHTQGGRNMVWTLTKTLRGLERRPQSSLPRENTPEKGG